MLEPMKVLDRLSRANAPHPSASPPPSPQGEGLTRYEQILYSKSRKAITNSFLFSRFSFHCGALLSPLSTLHSNITGLVQ
ncbi:MAG: hypothetical protein ACI4RP_03865 [Acutalibacteraceae bacterium]